MDKESKVLFWLLGVLVVFSMLLTYYRSFIAMDYEIIQESEIDSPEETGELETEQD